MTLNKAVLLAVVPSLVLLTAGRHPAHAASTATATVTITATFTAPPCTLTVPPTVFLGSILQGKQTYRPFSIDIACPTPTNTAIYAQQISGTIVDSSGTRMAMSGPPGGTPAEFWLESESKEIDLAGGGAGDATKGFCAGDTNRSCMLTPFTQVATDTPRGETTATVRF
ncbi:fimbrial protein, partial [Citrobacter freundii]|nr:fimbrial protein [Citrobacter freundii]MBC6509595.1 fimbrial protein [Citrobacter freundii]